MKKLVVSGCSHTEGTAFCKKRNIPYYTELSTPQLKEKYGKDKINKQWVKNNLTWGSKLSKIGNFKRFLNLGYGGQGPDHVTRVLYSYSSMYTDLSNHTVIIQIPAPERKLFFFNKNEHIFSNLLRSEDMFNKDQLHFLSRFYDASYYEYLMLEKFYRLQLHLESRNAKVRFFAEPFYIFFNTSKEHFKKLSGIFFPEYFDFNFLYRNLNLIKTKDFDGSLDLYLHHAGLKEGDMHFTEEGNSKLARYLYENIDNLNDRRTN